MSDHKELFSNVQIASDLADGLCSNALMDDLKRTIATVDPALARVHLEYLRRDLTATFREIGLPNAAAHADRQIARIESVRALLHTSGGNA